MAFETEPLKLKPLRWLEGTVAPGMVVDGKTLF
jgi:hypothetical protein